jgi:mannose-1-phosphate guanylyltransferase
MTPRGAGRARGRAAGEAQAVILAGGRGTRFWPLGRRSRPKQFLPIAGPDTMVEETVRRLGAVIPVKRVWTVADAAQTRALRRLLPRVPRNQFVIEPLARNTAPSLILATARIYLENPAAPVAVFPADHLIRKPARFRGKLAAALEIAQRDAAIVTFGITPSYPATGFGYIRFSEDSPRRLGRELFHRVRAFKEKPGEGLAAEFLAAGDSFWNSGMFVWRADVFAGTLKACAPDLFVFWERILEALKKGRPAALRRVFEEMPSISIDHALMERASGILVNEGDFGWSDVGAWSALLDIWKRDPAGNALKGETVGLDAAGCLVYNPGRLTALVGVRDLIVVETGDALLICAAGQDQRVREVVDILSKRGRKKYL